MCQKNLLSDVEHYISKRVTRNKGVAVTVKNLILFFSLLFCMGCSKPEPLTGDQFLILAQERGYSFKAYPQTFAKSREYMVVPGHFRIMITELATQKEVKQFLASQNKYVKEAYKRVKKRNDPQGLYADMEHHFSNRNLVLGIPVRILMKEEVNADILLELFESLE